LDQLPDRSREVILLDIFCGVPRDRLAALLGIPSGTLASRKHTAISQLRDLLDESD
jgi:RNA polymerase sigma-70 factor (ECF subfamily)